jgi:hypothetical protein
VSVTPQCLLCSVGELGFCLLVGGMFRGPRGPPGPMGMRGPRPMRGGPPGMQTNFVLFLGCDLVFYLLALTSNIEKLKLEILNIFPLLSRFFKNLSAFSLFILKLRL